MAGDDAGKSVGQAVALLRQGNADAAERVLAQCCERGAGGAAAWFLRGAIRAERGDPARAIDYLETAVGLDPANGEAYFTLCRLYLARGDLARAIESVEKVVALEPRHGEAWLALGSLCADTGRYRRAERASREAMALLPGVAEPKINLVNALISLGERDEALALCEALRSAGTAHAGIWHSLGLAYKALGRLAEAEECLARATRLDPENAAAHCALGDVRAARDDLAGALAAYRRSRDLDPTGARVHFQLGKLLLPCSSARHRDLAQRLQRDHRYRDAREARDLARQLAAGLRVDGAAAARALAAFFDDYDPARLYPMSWWRDALRRFGEPRDAADTALRGVYSAVFSYSLPGREALAAIAAFADGRMASYGSGAAYWEYLLAGHHGIEVVCHDIALRHRFMATRQVAHAAAGVDPADTLMLAWLPGEDAIDAEIEALLGRARPGQRLVLIGEPPDRYGQPRTCATRRFFRYLAEHFDTREELALPNYAYFHDRVELLVKR